ncbi:MAG: methyl-accepting chemotaxis protein [Bryobacteraceae bacterium]|jgi:methyl-accepting chemotaxis protein
MALSLRGKFAVWTSVVVVTSSLGLMLSVYLVSSRALRSQADEEMDRIVTKTTEELDLWIGSRERDAVNISELPALAAACTEHKLADAEEALARIHGRSPFYENVFLADENGKEFLDTVGGKSVGFDLTSVEGFRANVEHARQGELWLGDVMKSPATGRAVVLITAPIKAGGRVAGILGTPIALSDFSAGFVSNYKIRKTGYIYMFDASGMVLAHPDATKIMAFNINTLDFGREMLQRRNGALSYVYQGIAKTNHFKLAQKKPWIVAAAVPDAGLFSGVRTIQVYLALFGLAMLVGTVSAVSYLAGRASHLIGSAVSELAAAAQQFVATSTQISSSGQSLAQASSEQAASLEETSASAEQISAITRQNNERSQRVAQLMNEAIPTVNANIAAHKELALAIAGVSASSEKVSKVIKIIDEIAFQTNILALNAAVEAARAGESGAGFAVVADEVRNLAHRSADAAKETSALIEESLLKSRESKQTLDRLSAALEANNRVARSVKMETDEIRLGSEEQVRGIAEVTRAVAQMSQVTQSTAAQAEESASAAAGLCAQSTALKGIVESLSAMVSGRKKYVMLSAISTSRSVPVESR